MTFWETLFFLRLLNVSVLSIRRLYIYECCSQSLRWSMLCIYAYARASGQWKVYVHLYNAHVCDLNAVDTPHDRARHGMGDTLLQRVTVGLPLSFCLKLK